MFTESNTVEQMILDATAVDAHGPLVEAVAHLSAANSSMRIATDRRSPHLRWASWTID